MDREPQASVHVAPVPSVLTGLRRWLALGGGNIEAFLKHLQATLTRVLYAARRRWLGVTEADFEQAASAQRAGTLPGREDEGIQRVPPWRGPGRP